MGELIAWLCCIIIVSFVAVKSTAFHFDANDTVKILNEVCSKNGGIEYSKIDSESWYLTCKDSAKFTVKR